MYDFSKKMMIGLLVVGVVSAQLFGTDNQPAKRERSQSPEFAKRQKKATTDIVTQTRDSNLLDEIKECFKLSQEIYIDPDAIYTVADKCSRNHFNKTELLYETCRNVDFEGFLAVFDHMSHHLSPELKNDLLIISIDGQHYDLVDYIVGLGIIPNKKNAEGETALSVATKKVNQSQIPGSDIDPQNAKRIFERFFSNPEIFEIEDNPGDTSIVDAIRLFDKEISSR
jgi:hypothetical protein